MYAAERHRHIASLAQRDGRVEVSALADDLGVTVETIRRDLAALESRGVVRRVHGGALPADQLGFEPALQTREIAHTVEKARIADAAARLVNDSVRSILIDAGSTTTAFATAVTRSLTPSRELTIVTNSIPVAGEAVQHPGVHLHMLGGWVRPRTRACVGSGLAAHIAQIGVDIAFLGANGVHPTRGVTTPDDAEAAAKRLMAERAQTVVVLADSSKIGQTHLCDVVALADVDVVVTDDAADEDAVAQLRDAGPEVLLA